MPRHISETDRARIACHLENGRKIVDLAAEFGIGKSSVGRIKKKNGRTSEVLNETRVLVENDVQTLCKMKH
jgi:transposase-like protein